MDRQGSSLASLAYGLQTGPRKRRRKALSCYECRRRKVKCDRGAPSCNRCKEAGQADSCSYSLEPPVRGADGEGSESADELGHGQPTYPNASSPAANISDEVFSFIKQQARRIAQLEEKLAVSDARQSRELKSLKESVAVPRLSMAENSILKIQRDIEQQEQQEAQESEPIPVRGGKGFETKFYGASNSTSLISHFPELRTFIQEAFLVNSSSARIQRGLHTPADQQKGDKSQMLAPDRYLLTLLPRRETVDRLVKLYFEKLESMYRVLHQPTFWDEYNKFWQDPENGLSGFSAILLLVMAMVGCLSSEELYESSYKAISTRENWVTWIEACDIWLGHQSQKHLTLANFQVRCLLLLSKQMILMKEKRAWTSATALLSFSISTGLHRDPSLLSGRISIFDQEMRRRLWGTIVELEIEAAIDRGVRPFSADFPSDCPPPSNLDDSEFEKASEQLPKEKSSQYFTGTSFLCHLHTSRSFRTSLICLINNPKSNLQYDDILRYEGKLLHMIEDIPRWEDREGVRAGCMKTIQMLLDMQFRQLLLLLHSPWARQTESNPRYSYSRMVCINTAKYILEKYSTVTISGDYALLILRNDVVRAALSLCHSFYISRSIRDDLSSLVLGCTIFPLLDNMMLMLEEKLTRIERGYKNYIFVSAAYGLILSQECPEQSETHKYEAIERASRLYSKILATTGSLTGPDKLGNDQTPLPAAGVGLLTQPSPNFLMTNPPETMVAGDCLPFELFDYGNISDWPLDNNWPIDVYRQFL